MSDLLLVILLIGPVLLLSYVLNRFLCPNSKFGKTHGFKAAVFNRSISIIGAALLGFSAVNSIILTLHDFVVSHSATPSPAGTHDNFWATSYITAFLGSVCLFIGLMLVYWARIRLFIKTKATSPSTPPPLRPPSLLLHRALGTLSRLCVSFREMPSGMSTIFLASLMVTFTLPFALLSVGLQFLTKPQPYPMGKILLFMTGFWMTGVAIAYGLVWKRPWVRLLIVCLGVGNMSDPLAQIFINHDWIGLLFLLPFLMFYVFLPICYFCFSTGVRKYFATGNKSAPASEVTVEAT